MAQSISINARFLSQRLTGVQRYAFELVKTLDRLLQEGAIADDIEFTLIAPSKILTEPQFKCISLKQVGRTSGHLWEQTELPLHTAGVPLVSLCNTAPLVKSKQVLTIHDAAVYGIPEAYSLAFRSWYRFLFSSLGRRLQAVITVSEFSKSELLRYCPIPTEKLHVIYSGREHALASAADESVLSDYHLRDRPYFLAVSSLSPHKNFQGIVAALDVLGDRADRADFDVAIAGGTNPSVFGQSSRLLSDRVKYVGYVSDSQLRALYEHARGFIYPSLYEGFGLPPLEAMSCGCPTLVANAASLPEVCGDAALYCDPHDPADIAAKMRQLLEDDTLCQTLKQKGLDRATQFTWEACAKSTYQVIRDALL
ncbi:MAG: glycosyltransferase family 1 protein [Cyanobacteria bacterium P01_F01_bin.33]